MTLKTNNETIMKKYDSKLNKEFLEELMKRQRNWDFAKIVAYSLLILLIVLNNIFSILIFLIEEYITDPTHTIIIDMVIVGFYLVEFAYNFITHPPPKCSFFSLYFTWVDLITMATPIVNVFLDYDNA